MKSILPKVVISALALALCTAWLGCGGGESGGSITTTTTTSTSTTTTTVLARKVPDTGQTAINNIGDDATYTTNPPSFTLNGNGTVTDNVTGLIWQRQDDGIKRTWADAETYCNGLTLGEHTVWRLPDVKELADIVNYGTFSPSIDTTVFLDTKSSLLDSFYWTSTSNGVIAWVVNFSTGLIGFTFRESGIFNMGEPYYVRCVHGEPSTMNFTDNGNGTVTDVTTGLTWQKQDDGTARTWEQAISYCEPMSLGGNTDWRLPNVKELKSIADYTKFNLAIDSTFFPETQSSFYWSSTSEAEHPWLAWSVGFYSGVVGFNHKSPDRLFVRCVRGGL